MTKKENEQPERQPRTIVCLSEVKAEPITWLWKGRIPAGKLSLLDGDPGLGKSTLTLAIAAAMSTGSPMPGETDRLPPGNVLLVGVEDGLGDTIKPRLQAAGADMSRIHAFEHVVSLGEDLEELHRHIVEHDVKLVVLDPLSAVLGADANNEQRCRSVLTPLSVIAAETGAAVLMVRHLTKGGGRSAMYRGGGSIAIAGAARSMMLFTMDPNNPDQRVLAVTKSNLGSSAPAILLRFEQTDAEAAVLRYVATTDQSADALLASSNQIEKRTAVGEAIRVLQDLLSRGPVHVAVLKKRLGEAGVSWGTALRARMILGVDSAKSGFDGGWAWSLTEDAHHEGAQAPVSTFAEPDIVPRPSASESQTSSEANEGTQDEGAQDDVSSFAEQRTTAAG